MELYGVNSHIHKISTSFFFSFSSDSKLGRSSLVVVIDIILC
jgi:hypothetical protein